MTKIDDAMIERAAKAAYESNEPKSFTWEMAHEGSRDYWRKFIRAGLEAALSPEPEIPVSDGMIEAGRPHIIAGWEERPQYYCIDLAAIYRAMESARRKEAGKNEWGNDCLSRGGPVGKTHFRKGEGGPGGILRVHRRKDDPK